MFRPMRRKNKILPEETAKQLLLQGKRGVFAVNGDDGYPYAVPVSYFYDEAAGKIYFHGARAGHKYDALKKNDKVCFTVTGSDYYKEGEWAPYIQSVVVFGRCALIEDRQMTEEQVRRLALKFYPSAEEVETEIAKDIRAAQLYEITIEHMSGKQIQER